MTRISQQVVVSALEDFYRRERIPATVREVGELLGLASSSGVHYWLHGLERDGLAVQTKRGWLPVSAMKCPACGREYAA